jgi:hypothetical protein
MEDNLQYLVTAIDKQREAIALCLEKRCIVQGVTLIYIGIDNLAFACISDGTDATRSDFCVFVERFFGPEQKLGCTPLEIYGARCGLLHTYSADSKLFRQKKVRRIVYSWGNTDPVVANQIFSLDGWTSMHCVSAEALQTAYDDSVSRVVALMSDDEKFYRRLEKRAGQFLSHLPGEAMRVYAAGRTASP